jgi:threonine synthase
VVLAVPDEEILDAKALVGRYGLGCEPASAATIAGLRHLLANGTVDAEQTVACVLTGHQLKDPNVTVNYHKDNQGPYSNPPVEAPNDLGRIIELMQ